MRTISATDLAIATAIKAGTLSIVERVGRFGDTFFSLEDAFGVIEVHLDRAALDARLSAINAALS